MSRGTDTTKFGREISMKIVHLSDLHISLKNLPQNLEYTERLVTYGLEMGADHFVFTGDISHEGKDEDFLAFRNLLERYRLLTSEKTTLVIGNHDIYGGVHLARDIQGFPQKCRNTNIPERIRIFKDYFHETFETAEFPVPEDPMLFVKRVGEVTFLGMNSTGPYSLLRNPFAAAGQITPAQLAGLRRVLNWPEFDHTVKIALIHHHFCLPYKKPRELKQRAIKYFEEQGNKLRGGRRLMRLWRKYRVDLTLHGHVHYSHEYHRANLRFLSGGGAIDKNAPGELQINFVTVKDGQIGIEVRTIPVVPEAPVLSVERETPGLGEVPAAQLGLFTIR